MPMRLFTLAGLLLLMACNPDKLEPKYIPPAFQAEISSQKLANSDWTYRKLPFSGDGDLLDFAFLNESQGGVIMQYQDINYIWITQDGGLSWQLLSGTEQIKFLDIHAFENGELLLSGQHNTGVGPCAPGPYQWRSSDGGLSWSTTEYEDFDRYFDLMFKRDGSGFRKDFDIVPNNKNLCLGGYGGSNIKLKQSLDYGKSWLELGGCGWLRDTSSTSDPSNGDCQYNSNASMSIQLFPQQSEPIFAYGDTWVQDPDFKKVQAWLVKSSLTSGFVPFHLFGGMSPANNRYFWQGNKVFVQDENANLQHISEDNGKTWTATNYPEAAGGIWHPSPGSQQIIATDGNQFCVDEQGDFSFSCYNLPANERFAPIPKSFKFRDWDYQKVEIIHPNSLWTVVDGGLVYLSR
ncbi:MAG: hypothetical protein AAF927_33490 [Bacteroidota bacterium]